MDTVKLWVWLTNLVNITPGKITALLEHFGDIEEIYNAEPDAYSGIPGIGKRETMSLSYKDLANAEKIIDRTMTAGARILTFDDPKYPACLREIPAPPYVLYAKGQELDWDNLLLIGVVGTRKCTEYGYLAAQRICHGLADAGAVVVSGMARGIDSAAAAAALRAGGQTVAVLGCGIDIVYPPENQKLMEAIIKNGVVLTEYPPLSPAYPQHFPVRNRIISGLSKGVLAVEAPKRSGTLITTSYAQDLGKDIFSVPGSIFRKEFEGTNRLLQQGAKAVLTAEDILEEYPHMRDILEETKKTRPQKPVRELSKNRPEPVPATDITQREQYKNLNEDEKCIIRILFEQNRHIDDIVRETGFSIGKLNPMLAMMEMKGQIRKLAGNHYKLNV